MDTNIQTHFIVLVPLFGALSLVVYWVFMQPDATPNAEGNPSVQMQPVARDIIAKAVIETGAYESLKNAEIARLVASKGELKLSFADGNSVIMARFAPNAAPEDPIDYELDTAARTYVGGNPAATQTREDFMQAIRFDAMHALRRAVEYHEARHEAVKSWSQGDSAAETRK